MSMIKLGTGDFRHPCCCHFLYFLSIFLLLAYVLPLVSAISFNYPDFSDPGTLNLSGDADLVPGRSTLSLTKNRADSSLLDSVGRVVYSQELHLWDNSTGEVADFATHFSFNISKLEPPYGGDGIAFFMAPNGSQIPYYASGGCLALISRCSDHNTTVVAVEFDTYQDEWDPSDNHVGINVNSIRSVANIALNRSLSNGSKAHAWITYTSQTRNLSVLLSYDNNPVFKGNYSLSYEIDLSKVLPEFVSVGFSSSTGVRPQVHYLYSWEFHSTELSPQPSVGGGGGSRKHSGLIAGCVIAGVFVCGSFAVLIFYWRRNRGEKEEDDGDGGSDDSMDQEFEQGTGPKRFSYRELVQATNNFCEQGKLGEGGFGGVYKGYLSGLNVAVKRVSKGSKQGRKEYMSEVKIISKLRHKNLVQLLGWCHEKGELLLIYEFMPNGSLHSHLFREENMISWTIRYNIALGLASALLYLHEEWEQCVVHRDIKPSNVMLDTKFNTKLGDFGLARLMDGDELGLKTTGIAGTFGYMAPEYLSTGKASKGSDVFSFGVVALELACGRRSMEARNEESQISLVAWVWESYGNGSIVDVADRRLNLDYNFQEMQYLLMVGLWCAHPDYSLRPTIRQALQVLNFEAPMPNLPGKMPVPKYDVPSSSSSSTEPLVSNSCITVGR